MSHSSAPNSLPNCFSSDLRLFVVLALLSVFPYAQRVRAQNVSAAPAPSAAKPEIDQDSVELASHDEPAKFQASAKLVVVRVVARDSQGRAIGNLRKEDFEVFDKGKPQTITQFEIEQPGSLVAKPSAATEANSGTASADTSSTVAAAPVIPQHFVAYLFDDVHLEFGDLARVREAAERHLATLQPTDRAAIFTTSGLTILDFTDDKSKLRETLIALRPHPISSFTTKNTCPEISYYQADLIVNKHDPDALGIAVTEAIECGPQGSTAHGSMPLGDPAMVAQNQAAGVLMAGEQESHVALQSLNAVVRRVSQMPGQRTVVLASPGFLTPDMEYEYSDIIDHAVRSQVVINSLDARGLYVIIPHGDADHQPPVIPADSTVDLPPVRISITVMQTNAAAANADLLAVLADGTGGIFFHNNNDFNEGFRRLADTPEYSYILGFVPQNLKPDGSFHALKVKLNSSQKLSLQARRGYYAPKKFADADEQAKQEIEDEMFSQEELHNLPVTLHTQFFKASDQDAKLSVLAHVDVKQLHFRKAEGRNQNVLTCVSALFNRNGNFLEGKQKIVTMHLKDDTLEHKLASGITLKTNFDVKPGSYLVRLVVRDAEGQMMSAENGAVEIR